MKALRESLRAKHEELRTELDNEATDKAKIDGIAAELKKLEAQRIDQMVDHSLKLKGTLTPEQFKKFCDARKEHKGDRRGRHGKGGWRDHGEGQEDGE